ncbi:MAG: NlpC/P60 family protein [Betaproteobacteria bacterium]|nr:NlpC/P60 family protein [Betaproteobacteria bacterium]
MPDPIPEIVRGWTRLILPMLACILVGACTTAQVQYNNMLHDDEKYSPFANYFVIDDPIIRNEIVVQALSLVGTNYRWGGSSRKDGMDCSGLVVYAVKKASNRSLPHHAATIALMTRPIKFNELAPGDLVFFNTMKRRHSHVGIYLGKDRFVHAPAPGQTVRIDSLKTQYFAEHLDGLHTFARKTTP